MWVEEEEKKKKKISSSLLHPLRTCLKRIRRTSYCVAYELLQRNSRRFTLEGGRAWRRGLGGGMGWVETWAGWREGVR